MGIHDRRLLVKQVLDIVRDPVDQSDLHENQRFVRHPRMEEGKTAPVRIQAVFQIVPALDLEPGKKGMIKTLLERPDWHKKAEFTKTLKVPLMRLCAHYLAEEKRPDGIALDRVAHFHLSNGARIERLDWLGNTSPEGFRQSAGMMVNYRYKLDDIEANHEAYTGEKRVKISSAMRGLLRS